jgi:hypothetical protein
MTPRDPTGFDAPPFNLPPEPPQSRAWDWPLTPAVLCVLAGAVAFVVVLAVAGALP